MTRSTRSRTARLRRRGFTLIELLIVLALIGILANVAIPVYLGAVRKAKATAIVTDFTFLRQEITRYHTEQGAWPRGAGWGREPRDLRPYLEGKMKFDHGTHEYRLRNRMRVKEGRRPWRLALMVRGDKQLLRHVERIWNEPLYTTRFRGNGLRITFAVAR